MEISTGWAHSYSQQKVNRLTHENRHLPRDFHKMPIVKYVSEYHVPCAWQTGLCLWQYCGNMAL